VEQELKITEKRHIYIRMEIFLLTLYFYQELRVITTRIKKICFGVLGLRSVGHYSRRQIFL
jgi:hypothetical protein